jgi:phosphocarrier protein
VKIASRFRSDISVRKDEDFVNGKSILGVMTIAAEFGSSLIIRADGDDAEAAVTALVELVDKGFNEL